MEHAPQGLLRQAVQGTPANGGILPDAPQKQIKPVLPGEAAVALPNEGKGLLLKGPGQKLIDVLKVVVKGVSVDAAVIGDLLNGDFLKAFPGHQLFERRGHLSLPPLGQLRLLHRGPPFVLLSLSYHRRR